MLRRAIAVSAMAIALSGSALCAEPDHPQAAPSEPEADTQSTVPSPNLTPDQVVRIQIEALQHNDTPYPDAGIVRAFTFASPGNKAVTGPLQRFIQMVHNPYYEPMLNHVAARYGKLVVLGSHARVSVLLTAADGNLVGYEFTLSKQAEGEFKDCWMTDGVAPVPTDES